MPPFARYFIYVFIGGFAMKKFSYLCAGVLSVLLFCTSCGTQAEEETSAALSVESTSSAAESTTVSSAEENTSTETEAVTSISDETAAAETVTEINTAEEREAFVNALELTNAVEAQSEPETDKVYALWQSEDKSVGIYGVVLVPVDDENRDEDDNWYMIIEHDGIRDYFNKRWYSWYTQVLMNFTAMTDDSSIIFVDEYAGHGMGTIGFSTSDMYLFELNENGHYEIITSDKEDIIAQIKSMVSVTVDKDNAVIIFEAGDTKFTDDVDIACLRGEGYTEEEIDNCATFFEEQWDCEFDGEKIIVNTAYLTPATASLNIPHEFYLNVYINYDDGKFTVEKCEFYKDPYWR